MKQNMEMIATMRAQSRYRWFVVGVFFVFLLLHQADKLLIGPLTTPIMEEFGIDEAQMGAVFTGALLVGAILYPVWGYLCDKYARAKLLALASLIWGATTWLSAIVPTYGQFLVTRASTGIDDSSYPGLFSLISDYFAPRVRGKVNGVLQLTGPLGYMLGLVLALVVAEQIGWRNVFLITGALGVMLALVIYLGVREVPRGSSEPELEGMEQLAAYRFDPKAALGLLRRRSLIPLFLQGFFGVFPWNVIAYWFFRYLETERGYTSEEVLPTMAIAVLVLSAGFFVGGALGDALFRRTRRGRLIVSSIGVLMGALLLLATLQVPVENQGLFLVMLSLTALFIPFSGPNVVATVYDITPPEVRSTALAVQYFIESGGAALSPFLAGVIARETTLGNAILVICFGAWAITWGFLLLATYLAPRDIEALREQMRERAAQTSPPTPLHTMARGESVGG